MGCRPLGQRPEDRQAKWFDFSAALQRGDDRVIILQARASAELALFALPIQVFDEPRSALPAFSMRIVHL